jgi:3-hydroxyacyl-CoA dehydrogenase
MTKEDCENKFSLLSGVLDYEQFRDADVVIEVDPISIYILFFSYLLTMRKH